MIGYIARKTNYHVVALLIGVILGPLLEANVMRALRISGGELSVFFSTTVANALWVMLVVSLVLPPISGYLRRKRASASTS